MRSVPKPSPAMLVAIAALFVALSGTGIAASTLVNGSKIKKNTIPGNRLKAGSIEGSRLADDTVTGKQVKESTLAKVPSAAQADAATQAGTATRATSAGSADSAAKATSADSATKAATADNAGHTDGMDLTSFDVKLANGATDQTVMNDFDGLTLKASCTTGPNNGLTIRAQSSVSAASISWTAVSRALTAKNNAYSSMGPGLLTLTSPSDPTTPTSNGPSDIPYTSGTIDYANDDGGRVSITWAHINGAGPTCRFHGVAVGRPAGPGGQSRSGGGPAHPVSQAERAAP